MTRESHAASADPSGSGRALAFPSSTWMAGPRADVHQRHSLRRAQVTSYRLAPLREPVAWDLADRLERCSGLLVIADPGHVMPPCWASFRLHPPGYSMVWIVLGREDAGWRNARSAVTTTTRRSRS